MAGMKSVFIFPNDEHLTEGRLLSPLVISLYGSSVSSTVLRGEPVSSPEVWLVLYLLYQLRLRSAFRKPTTFRSARRPAQVYLQRSKTATRGGERSDFLNSLWRGEAGRKDKRTGVEWRARSRDAGEPSILLWDLEPSILPSVSSVCFALALSLFILPYIPASSTSFLRTFIRTYILA